VKRLLVTGASGLLGLNFLMQAAGRYDLVGVLRRERLAPQAKAPFRPVYADLTETHAIGRLLDETRPDAVIHCAAMTDVDYCETHAEEAARINALVPEVLAQETCCRKIALVHISTDAVFDGLAGNYCENDPPRPINVYARTKLEGERRVMAAYPDAIVARVNFYGWSWQGQRSLAEWFFNNLSQGIPVRGFTNLLFCPLHANQMVEILLEMLNLNLHGLYHVVSSEAQSKYQFGRMLARQFGFDETLIAPYDLQTGDLRAARSRRLHLHCDKLAQALGHPLPGQAEAMHEFYELYRSGYVNTLRAMFERSER